jgi:GNAT superfamily N-acetyltransferase
MQDLDDLQLIALTPERIVDALSLSSEAGWNQIDLDWKFMLGAGESFGFIDPKDRLVASGLTVEFQCFAWISMILVTGDWRRRGLATRLMAHCIDSIQRRGLVPALDASPVGHEVYRKIGFRDAGTSTRLVGDLSLLPAGVVDGVERITEADWPDLVAYDTRSSGTNREALLRHLWHRLPQAGFVVRRSGSISGYVLGRRGRRSGQIGPLLAEDEYIATALLSAAGREAGGPVCLDLFDQRATIRAWLDSRGFVPATRFIRMVHGSAELFPEPHQIYVIAGPELG